MAGNVNILVGLHGKGKCFRLIAGPANQCCPSRARARKEGHFMKPVILGLDIKGGPPLNRSEVGKCKV